MSGNMKPAAFQRVVRIGSKRLVGMRHRHPPETEWPKWLGEEPASEDELPAMLKPSADEMLKMWPVGTQISKVKNNGAELLIPRPS
jgi:putative SOS response-associated peptidase YedK